MLEFSSTVLPAPSRYLNIKSLSKKVSCYQHNHKTVDEPVDEADNKFFSDFLHNKHVLNSHLPGTTEIQYYLRSRCYNLTQYCHHENGSYKTVY